jgi:radical S-adenosyl methionine domain-containing protein 2
MLDSAIESYSPINIDELVINYHINEACNFNCTFCYSKWELTDKKYKCSQDIKNKMDLISLLYDFFRPDSKINPLKKIANWNSVRINLSGGEPLLIRELDQLILHAFSVGFRVSLVTNGSLLNEKFIENTGNYLCKLGLSMDSPNVETQIKIGRVTKAGKYCTNEHLKLHVDAIRKMNNNIIIKINSVIGALNCNEDFSPMIDYFSPY